MFQMQVLYCRDSSTGLGDADDDIIFEDFARLRLKAGESDAWGRGQAGESQPASSSAFRVLRTHVYVTCE